MGIYQIIISIIILVILGIAYLLIAIRIRKNSINEYKKNCRKRRRYYFKKGEQTNEE